AMAERAAANPNFPTICSLGLPEGVKSVRVIMPSGSATTLVAPVASPERILVLGDTGCRIKGAYLQACNDPIAWPFAGLAKAAASLKPDLVIHLGDYLYRESPCPEGNAGCAGSPYGDDWASWNADLFTPAAPLLAAAPWLIVRGNHEDCSRGGAGFLRLLGPVAFDPAAPCSEHLSPYAVTAGNQVIAVLDSASASDTSVDDKSLAVYRADFDALKTIANASAGHELWLVGHRPIWAAISGPLGIPVGGNATMIAAAGDLSPFAAISLMLSGHIHTFEAINYDAKVPPQIVAGHGGDNLDATPANLRGTIFQGHSGVSVKDGLSVGGFGFLLMTRNAGQNSWTIQLYDSAGTPERQCVFAGDRVSCPLPK
ncbi:MAG: metallophosphoesterase, partial [Rhizomicrobium sp.]